MQNKTIKLVIDTKHIDSNVETLLKITRWNYQSFYDKEYNENNLKEIIKNIYSNKCNVNFNNLSENKLEVILENISNDEYLKFLLRQFYYENNGLVDHYPEDFVESRTDYDELKSKYLDVIYKIQELMN